LYESLRLRAERDHRSISQEVVSMIEAFLAQPAGREAANATDEFCSLAGTWEDDRPAHVIAKEIRSARGAGRRFRQGAF